MIGEYIKNLETMESLVKEIAMHEKRIANAYPNERKLLSESTNALRNNIKIINASLPKILKEIGIAKELPVFPRKGKEITLERIESVSKERNINVTIDKKQKEKFLQELRISEEALKQMKKSSREQIEKEGFKGSSIYLKSANKFFLKNSRNLLHKGYFGNLGREIRKANMEMLTESYVSLIIFTSILAFAVGIIGIGLLTFISYNSSEGFIIFHGNYFIRALSFIWLPFLLGIGTFAFMYFYPSTEKGSIEKRINNELPFAVVQMSAIAGSGIEPSAIFRIVALGKEYPYLRKEIRKVLNQINVYGYDLVTALNNVSKSSPSEKLAELFSGLSTTITSGGSMSEFFQKRAESLTLAYRLDREKFIKVAETSMDLYITVVIAAPMILLLIFVLLSISELGASLSLGYLTFVIIGLIAIINVIFLAVLHYKQPGY